MSDRSSCDPLALFHYHAGEQHTIVVLAGVRLALDQTLVDLTAKCHDYPPPVPVQLTLPLLGHEDRLVWLAQLVLGVALAFLQADGEDRSLPPGPLFLAALGQTRPIDLDDAATYPAVAHFTNARFKLVEPQPGTMADLAALLQGRYRDFKQQSDTEQPGPIGITNIGPNRYLVTLVGIEWDVDDRANRLANAVVDHGTPFNSHYFNIVKKTIRANIPAGAELVFAAHSHGGIVAQNLAGDSDFNQFEDLPLDYFGDDDGNEYAVSEVITFGSPVSQLPTTQVDYHMFAIDDDIVPMLRVAHPFDTSVMRSSGRFHYLDNAPDGKGPHSLLTYAFLLRRNAPLNDLGFAIDEWGPTYTFSAYDWQDTDPEFAPFPPEER